MDRRLPPVSGQLRNPSSGSNAVGNGGHKSAPNLRGGLLKGGSFRAVTNESMAQEICRHLEWAQGMKDDVDRKDPVLAEPHTEQALSASPSKVKTKFAALRAENQILRQRLAKSEARLADKALHNGGLAGNSNMVRQEVEQLEAMLSMSSAERENLATDPICNETEERSPTSRRPKRRSIHFSRRSKSEDTELVRAKLRYRREDNLEPKVSRRKKSRNQFSAYSQKVVGTNSPKRELLIKGSGGADGNDTVQVLKQHAKELASLEADLVNQVKGSGGMDRNVSSPGLLRKPVVEKEVDAVESPNTEASSKLIDDPAVVALRNYVLSSAQESPRKTGKGTREKRKQKDPASPKASRNRKAPVLAEPLEKRNSEETSAATLRKLSMIMRSGSRDNLENVSYDDAVESKPIKVDKAYQEAAKEISFQLPSAIDAPQKTQIVLSRRASVRPVELSLSAINASPKAQTPSRRATLRPVELSPVFASPRKDSARNKVHQLSKEMVVGIFRRLSEDGEVHKDSLPWALQLGGYPKANPDWIKEELEQVTRYDAMDLSEFILFVENYELHEHNAAKELFHKFDDNGNGSLELDELPGVFQSMGISPLSHVVRDIVKDIAPVTPDELIFDEFWQVILHLRANEGFTRSEVKYFEDLFRKFDADDSGSLESKELSRILIYLGHAMEEERVTSILKEVDVDNNGSLDIREFVVCMGKVREYDVENMQDVFAECDEDGSGGIQGEELVIVLRQLGYFPEIDDIADACTDVNMRIDDELNFDQLWEFLQAYRGREGFSRADMTEIREVFETAEKVKDMRVNDQIEVLELGRLFALLGCIVPCDQLQCFVANVDIDGSGYLDLKEFAKVVRQSYHLACQQAQKTFVEQYVGSKKPPITDMITSLVPGAHMRDVERIVERLNELRKENGGLDQFDFVSAVNTLKRKTARQAKRNFGFGVNEVNALRALFTKYDKDQSGVLRDSEAIAFFESEYPEVAMCIENRPILMDIMRNAQVRGAIDFRTFLRLVRKCQDLADHNKIRREREAITKTGFSGIEVKEFREIFLAATIEQERETVTRSQLMVILQGLVAPSYQNIDAVRREFYEVTDGKEEAEFSCFLLIFRRLLDLNIGSIANHAARRVAEVQEDEAL